MLDLMGEKEPIKARSESLYLLASSGPDAELGADLPFLQLPGYDTGSSHCNLADWPWPAAALLLESPYLSLWGLFPLFFLIYPGPVTLAFRLVSFPCWE